MRVGINVNGIGLYYVDNRNSGLESNRKYVDLPYEVIECLSSFDKLLPLCESTVKKLKIDGTKFYTPEGESETLIKLQYDWLLQAYQPVLKRLYDGRNLYEDGK